MKRNIDNISKLYEIQIPSFDSSVTKNFSFNTKVGGELFTFYFRYSTSLSRWSAWAVMPDLSTRLIGVIPGVLNWSRYMDYSLFFNFSGQNISLGNLIDSTIYLIAWKL